MTCRICLESDGVLISPCACKGTGGYVHEHCLKKWIDESKSYTCEICKYQYKRKETCACAPYKYLKGCFDCKSQDDIATNYISVIFFIVSAVVYAFIEPENFILFGTILTFVVILCGITYKCILNEAVTFYNVIIRWKLASCIPYIIALFLYIVSNEDRCDFSCTAYMHACDETCPLYHEYIKEANVMDKSLFYELINITIMLGIRGIVLCFTHMRNLKFTTAFDEELESLICKTSRTSSTSSGGINGSDSSFSSSGSFSDFDIEEAAMNDNTDNSA